MSLKKTNDNRGSYRGAGAYSKDYAKFDGWPGESQGSADYPTRDIYAKVEGVGDYETDRAFTGKVDGVGNKQRWRPLADRQNTRGDGAYSHEGRRSTERARTADRGKGIRGSKVSD